MKRRHGWAVLMFATAWPLIAQPQEAPPAFDAASVKPHDESNPLGTMMQERPGNIHYRRINLLAVIRRAYNVESQQIVAPAWLSTETYDIEAKLSPDTPLPRLRLMLQTLLAERFHLKVHYDKKELPAYNLVLAKGGLKMHRSEGGGLGYMARPKTTRGTATFAARSRSRSCQQLVRSTWPSGLGSDGTRWALRFRPDLPR
jgi:uncharacterized protein (TIGR03435 family)